MIPGICNVCQETLFGSESRSHIARCVETRYGLRATRAALKGRRRTVHISVGSPEHPHWMELGVRADTTLHKLDSFLRSVWLECCGHLSHFDISEPVHDLLRISAVKASTTICRLVLSFLSQFFQSRRHFCSQAKDRSTTHRFGRTTKV